MIRFILIVLVMFNTTLMFAQSNSLKGIVHNDENETLPSATVSLLNPEDSTFAHFAITNNDGYFALNNIPGGDYLLQIAFVGHKTYYQDVTSPFGSELQNKSYALKQLSQMLGEVQISDEMVPLLIRDDTLEYNAGAFKTKPGAVAEDILKQLPGVEVDRAGNIKAMGENVSKVLVDGKEFFSNDPKVATKNLPAESVDKVQVYNEKSDESEMLEIDDSDYQKTINLTLKDDVKGMVFGHVEGGAGYDKYYSGSSKVYRFTDKHQFAALAMANNMNRPGFSFQDYLDFNGGLSSLMSEGGNIDITIEDGGLPVDFGQSEQGELSTGAGGINYSYELAKKNDLNVSYMGSGSFRDLAEKIYTRNFLPVGEYEQHSRNEIESQTINHLVNFGWRNRANKKHYFMLNGTVSYNEGVTNSTYGDSVLQDNIFIRSLDQESETNKSKLSVSGKGSWLQKFKSPFRIVKLASSVNYNQSFSDYSSVLQEYYNSNPDVVFSQPFSNSDLYDLKSDVDLKTVVRFTGSFFGEFKVNTRSKNEQRDRTQGLSNDVSFVDTTIVPEFRMNYKRIKPGVELKKYLNDHKFYAGSYFEIGEFNNIDGLTSDISQQVNEWLPYARWEYEYRTGHRIAAGYFTSTRMPTSYELQPVISNTNPMNVLLGNRTLEHEYRHTINANWMLFDQFSFTSLFVTLRGAYIENKIGKSVAILDDLAQQTTLVNVPEEYEFTGQLDFSTPIRFLGLKVNLNFTEQMQKGMSYVNDVLNNTDQITHRGSLSFENRKKEKFDVRIGGKINYTWAAYSLQKELNREYYNYSGFVDVSYTPTDRWYFGIVSDVTSYQSSGFDSEVTIPIVEATIKHHFLAENRATISLHCFDMLDQNKGLQRIAEMNYLRESKSNTIGRFFMLSFRYRLNKTKRNSGIVIDKR